MPWAWIPDTHDYVLIPKAWDQKKSRLMTQYIVGLVELLQLPDGPDELGILQICEELDADTEMFSAVWAHLYTWQRNRIRDIRDDRRRQTEPSPYVSSYHGREVRGAKG